jgi:hypothetical protein
MLMVLGECRHAGQADVAAINPALGQRRQVRMITVVILVVVALIGVGRYGLWPEAHAPSPTACAPCAGLLIFAI